MSALALIKQLDVLEDRLTRFVSILEVDLVHQLVFQCEGDAFRHSIVVTLTHPAPAGGHHLGSKIRLILSSHVLTALVRVHQRVSRAIAAMNGHGKRITYELSVRAVMHRPAWHWSAAGCCAVARGQRGMCKPVSKTGFPLQGCQATHLARKAESQAVHNCVYFRLGLAASDPACSHVSAAYATLT